MNFTYNKEAMGLVLKGLADAVQSRDAHACGHICTAVANLIAQAGRHGGMEQRNMMDLATQAGFACEYYVNSIRVYFGDTVDRKGYAKRPKAQTKKEAA